MEVLPLFSTPLYKEIIDFDIDMEYLENLVYFPYADGSGHSSDNQNILKEEPFLPLKEKIEENLNYFYFDVLKFQQGKLTHVASWINLHKPGDHSPRHIHSNSCYSGVYYLNAPVNGGGITFHQPDQIRTYAPSTVTATILERNIFNSYGYHHELTKNLLFLFPSHLEHSTQHNNSNENRYCLAFNYFIEGELGTDTGRVNLRIITE